ncbi:MAG: hypothetical protein JST54_32720 [Deltaproteobacteria bacterium]|nr:hypothetical protein [Deltaproteobacteria bacterium]
MSRAMPRLTTLVLVSFVAGIARAETEPPAPLAPPPQADCANHPDDPGCRPPAVVPPVNPTPAPTTPVPEKNTSSGGSGVGSLNLGNCGGGGGGGGEGVVILAAAVVGAALLPVIVYVVDDDASPADKARWEGLSTRVVVYGGTTTQAGGNPSTGFVGGRATLGYQLLGVEAGIESSMTPSQYAMADAGLMLRLPPRAHVELGFSVGGKVLQLDGHGMAGVEIAVPHRYLFGELFQKRVAFDVRPSVAFNGGDLALLLDGGLQIPLPGPLSARIGGRVYSLDHDIEASGFGGLELGI